MHTTPKDLAQAHGLTWIDEVEPGMLDPALLEHIPVTWAREQAVLPVRHEGEPCLLTASADCLMVLQQAQLATGLDLRPLLADADTVAAAIDAAYYARGARPSAETTRPAEQAGTPRPERMQPAGADLLAGAEAAPATQLLNGILLEAVRQRASDIHFEPHPDGLRVRYRIDGGLYEQPPPPTHFSASLTSRIKVMARLDIAEKRLPQDGMLQVRVGGRGIDVRVSTLPVADGERAVLRLLNRESAWLPLADLGLPERLLERFREMLGLPHGLLVVSGPTGSGKTTTLYSALGTLDATRRNILTIEDPVEYRLPAIGQLQVKPKIGLTFAAGLRHILRQDPDVVLVGETRDTETAEIAVRAALTGHLVFTTLHTNDAAAAAARLVDMGVEPFLLASCLRGVLAQRLVRCLCRRCRRPRAAAAPIVLPSSLESERETLQQAARWVPGTCPECLDGYRGRTGLFELLPCTETVSEAIVQGGSASTLREIAGRIPDYRPLRDDASEKLAQGVTDLHEVLTALIA